LFPHTSHQEEFKPQPLFLVASSEELVQVFLLVNLGLFFGETRPVVFLKQLPGVDFLCLQKTDDVLKLVGDTARGLILLVPKEGRELQQVFALNVFEKLLGT
jgi:hypothetical protein